MKDIYDTVEDFENVKRLKWDPDFAGPLVKTSLSLEDLALDSFAYVRKDKDGLLYLVYEGEAGSIMGKDAVSLDDQNADVNFSLTPQQISEININDSVMAYYNLPVTFDFQNDMDLDSLSLLNGSLQIDLNNEMPSDCRMVFNCPTIRKDGETLNGSLSFSAGASASKSFQLENANFDLSTLNPAYNRLPIDVFLYVKKGSNLPLLTDQIRARIAFKSLNYDHLFGLLSSEQVQDVKDTIDLNVLDNASIDQFTIEDPRLKFRFFNSFGVEMSAGIQPVQFISKDGNATAITGIPNPLPIPVPGYDQVGETLVDSFEINRQTSNFASELANKPSRFVYHAVGALAPGTKRGFINHQSTFRVEVAAEVPLWGSVRSFVLEQETDFVADLPEETDYIRELNLRLFTENRFPMSIDVQAYFLDSSGNILDSLLGDGTQLLPAAAVDQDGRVVNAVNQTLNIPFDKSRISALQQAVKLRIRAKLDTYNSGGNYPSVKFYEDYDLKMKIALQFGLNVEEEL